MRALISDFRTAVRAFAAARGFTATAVTSLGIGIALAVTILTVVNAYVMRGLPYPSAERLVRIDYAPPNQPAPRGMERLDWRMLDDVIEAPIAWDLDVFFMLGREYPESAPGAWVTPGYMDAFGVRPVIGRTFVASDYEPASPPVALISHQLWLNRFGGDATVVGRAFEAYVSDRPEEPESMTVIGVLPADFWHLNVYTQILAPLKAPSYPYMARLRPGVPLSIAAARIDALIRTGIASLPPHFNVVLTPAHESYVGTLRPALWSVTAAAGLVLLIAAANVAVLMLIRARRREKELAVRLALGASHIQVTRLLAVEGLCIGVVSTVVGITASAVALRSVGPLVEGFLQRRVPGGLEALAIDRSVLAGAALCGLIVTVVFTVFPLMASRRSSLVAGLSVGGRAATAASGGRSRALLIAIEVAASLALLAGAGLMARTAIQMLRVDFGVLADDVVTASLSLRQRSFPDDASRAAFVDRVSRELAGSGSAVALGDWWPLQGTRPRRIHTAGSDAIAATANPFAVTSGYFDTLGMSRRDGRVFTESDRLGSEPVAVVSETLARRLWPGARPIGEQVSVYLDDALPPVSLTVVGVVNDVRQSHTDNDLSDIYFPLVQRPSRFAFLYVRHPRSATWQTDLRATVARINSEVAVGPPQPLSSGLEQERARPRFLAVMLTTFAAIACLLALVGMHGVIAYAVRERQREIAVRIAIGGSTTAVTAMFLREGVVVLAGGLLAGILGAIALGRVLQSQLFGVGASEPWVLGAVAAAFAACAFIAMLWPAWRAASIDPVLVLKDE